MADRGRAMQARHVAELEGLFAIAADADQLAAAAHERAAQTEAAAALQRRDDAVEAWQDHLGQPRLAPEIARLLADRIGATDAMCVRADAQLCTAAAKREAAERASNLARARRRAAERAATTAQRQDQRRIEDRRLAELPPRPGSIRR